MANPSTLTGSIGVFLGLQLVPTIHQYGFGFFTQQAWNPEQNVIGMMSLLDAVKKAEVHRFVLSSSAAVYGAHADNPVPMTEASPLNPNPGFRYAEEKVALEQFLAYLRARLETHPDMHVYHYAAYERTHLLSLAARHFVGEHFVDDGLGAHDPRQP